MRFGVYASLGDISQSTLSGLKAINDLREKALLHIPLIAVFAALGVAQRFDFETAQDSRARPWMLTRPI